MWLKAFVYKNKGESESTIFKPFVVFFFGGEFEKREIISELKCWKVFFAYIHTHTKIVTFTQKKIERILIYQIKTVLPNRLSAR